MIAFYIPAFFKVIHKILSLLYHSKISRKIIPLEQNEDSEEIISSEQNEDSEEIISSEQNEDSEEKFDEFDDYENALNEVTYKGGTLICRLWGVRSEIGVLGRVSIHFPGQKVVFFLLC